MQQGDIDAKAATFTTSKYIEKLQDDIDLSIYNNN
jgi:hypothetical protein